MGFRLPKGVRDYYNAVNNRDDGGIKFKTMFDIYYLCVMIGLDKAKNGLKENLEPGEFVDYYPDQYADKGDLIAGLLIDAEMRRLDISPEDKKRIENLMLEVIDQYSSTRLNKDGEELLNEYAVMGYEVIQQYIAKTSELETFLVQYFKVLNATDL